MSTTEQDVEGISVKIAPPLLDDTVRTEGNRQVSAVEEGVNCVAGNFTNTNLFLSS